MELLSLMAVMSEGLGFNLCVVVGGGWSWVGGVILESDRGRLSQDHSEDEG